MGWISELLMPGAPGRRIYSDEEQLQRWEQDEQATAGEIFTMYHDYRAANPLPPRPYYNPEAVAANAALAERMAAAGEAARQRTAAENSALQAENERLKREVEAANERTRVAGMGTDYDPFE